jgi:nitrate/TMAO reductase-like tetraheme cytochrome c subunit
VSRILLSLLLAVCLVAAVTVVPLAFADQPAPPETITLKASMGNITFPHGAHAKMEGTKCTDCHHASKPEKPKKTDFEACRDCHTKPATAPVKAALPMPFHNPVAKAGLCIDCHTKAANDKAPTKCAGCHKRA